jgi:hypothetical protein
MTTLMDTTTQNKKIAQFVKLFKDGVDAWIKAGEILIELVEDDPHVYDYIIQQSPSLNAGILGRFEQMGRKSLHPQLLLSASPGFARLQKLPYSMQERFIEEPIPLIIHTDNGTDVLLVKAKDLTKDQATQVFSANRLRTEGEQKAWLIQQRSNSVRTVGDVSPWRLTGDSLIVRTSSGEVRFPRSQLAAFVAQLTK